MYEYDRGLLITICVVLGILLSIYLVVGIMSDDYGGFVGVLFVAVGTLIMFFAANSER